MIARATCSTACINSTRRRIRTTTLLHTVSAGLHNGNGSEGSRRSRSRRSGGRSSEATWSSQHRCLPRRFSSTSSSSAASPPGANSDTVSESSYASDIVIIGGGIAGICTAHYLLCHPNSASRTTGKNMRVRIVDRLDGVARGTSRINGALLCPSRSDSWTTHPIIFGRDSMLSIALKRFIPINGSGKHDLTVTAASSVSFDPKLLFDRRLLTFGMHWLRRRPYTQDRVIGNLMKYSMECYDDIDDDIIQSLQYDRTAVGTKTYDGTKFDDIDSSGDVHLFCSGLHDALIQRYGGDDVNDGENENGNENRFEFHGNLSVESFVAEDRRVQSVKLKDSQGNSTEWSADRFVICAGNESYDLCRSLGVPCPIFPVKGYIIRFHSDIEMTHNLELLNRSYVSPLGKGKYHLSGLAEFTSDYDAENAMEVNMGRAQELIEVAKAEFPDMIIDSVHVGYRPLTPDDTPMVGMTTRYENLYINAGGGSKGWTLGAGSGKLLADIMLGASMEGSSTTTTTGSSIDPTPYSPARFDY
mmetsp:Transcript_8300/g.16884  ORF Transcript_8300/g.16884 Transcript_8300/m.16884 type:complete len:529 (-) Transcript_8300:774-2360(-)